MSDIENFPSIPPDPQPGFLRRIAIAFGAQAPAPEAHPTPPALPEPLRVGDITSAQSTSSYAFEHLNPDTYTDMYWLGTLDQVVAAVQPHIENDSLDMCYWMSGRILRGILDTRIDEPRKVELVTLASRLLLEQFNGNPSVDIFHRLAAAIGKAGIGATSILQRYDRHTEYATYPGLSMRAAAALSEKIEGRPLLLMPLCHGGLIAGAQTALLYMREHPESDTAFYPVRFSRTKKADHWPRVGSHELEHIRTLAENREVIIFDEDTNTGKSVRGAVRYFRSALSARRVLGLANRDMRPDDVQHIQGTWWQYH